MTRLQELALAYVLFLFLFSACWLPLHGWEEAKRRLRVLPLYLVGMTAVLALLGGIMWLILPPEARTFP
jgi:hypothetical protein